MTQAVTKTFPSAGSHLRTIGQGIESATRQCDGVRVLDASHDRAFTLLNRAEV